MSCAHGWQLVYATQTVGPRIRISADDGVVLVNYSAGEDDPC
jgi:hypothetical protein